MSTQLNYMQSQITGPKILTLNYSVWENQRPLNPNTVQNYKIQQLNMIRLFGKPIFTDDIILAEYQNRNYLVDGQHRLEMIKQLMTEGVVFESVQIKIFECKTYEQITALYIMANTHYTINGNIDSNGNLHQNVNKTQTVIDRLRAQYNNFTNQNRQRKGDTLNAPYFDIGDLTSQLNSSVFLRSKSVDEIMALITRANDQKRREITPKQITNCLDGFYLCYGAPKCRWISAFK